MQKELYYDKAKYNVKVPTPVNTLQLFITNKCNMRCKACFYSHNLGTDEMNLEQYKHIIAQYIHLIDRVVLLGGEPTMHPNIEDMIKYNDMLGLKTTIYSNGINLDKLQDINLRNAKIRIGVYGATKSEKPLFKIPNKNIPITIVYMLRRDNVSELTKTAKLAESYNCKVFYISSIRDITKTQDFWIDTDATIPIDDYYDIVQNFVNNYTGKLELHIACRGIIRLDNAINRCRFGNVFPDNKKIICPLDISKKMYCDNLVFNKRTCDKNNSCLLQKIILKRVTSFK
jgi:MoaA/NifB/PqqE/SkfB family radical SAM enzyme